MSKDKKVLHKDIEWGNIELPNLSDEELFDPYINVKIRNKSDEKVKLNRAITQSWWTDEKRKQQSEKLKAYYAKHGSVQPDDYVMSDETKQKISNKLKGRKLSADHIEKLKVPASQENKAKNICFTQGLPIQTQKNKVTCVHCKIVVPIDHYAHGDNCTLKDYSIVARDIKGNICNIYSDYASLLADGVSYYHLTNNVLNNKKTNKYRKVFWTKEKTKQIKKVKITAIVYKRNQQVKLTCPHCGKQGGATNMKRFHMDNCKSKLTQ